MRHSRKSNIRGLDYVAMMQTIIDYSSQYDVLLL
jgi:hypothetical protein